MIYLGADHNGFALKERVKKYLVARRLAWVDCGAKKLAPTDDYVDFAVAVGRRIKKGDMGILLCGSGHGMVIAANKLAGVRAIMPLDPKSARFGRHDDHANILVLAAWQMSAQRAEKILSEFLKQKPSNSPRYLRRLKKITILEK